MAKITVAGGPSDEAAGPGEVGYIPPEDEKPKGRGKVTRRTTGADVDTPAVEVVRGAKATDDDEDEDDSDDKDGAGDKTGEGGERPSDGSSSQTSTGKPPSGQRTNEPDGRSPAPTTGSRSSKDRTGSSTAGTTAGDQTGSRSKR